MLQELEQEFQQIEENISEANDNRLIMLVETSPLNISAKIQFLVKKLRKTDRELNDNIRGQQQEMIRNRKP